MCNSNVCMDCAQVAADLVIKGKRPSKKMVKAEVERRRERDLPKELARIFPLRLVK